MKRPGPPERRTPLKRGKPPARSRNPIRRLARLPRRSRKRAAIAGERRAFVERILTRRPSCEMGPKIWFYVSTAYDSYDDVPARLLRVALACTGRSVDVHEIKTRTRSGGVIVPSQGLGDEDVLAACRPCHHFATTEPALALAIGLVVNSWDKPPSQA